MVQHGGPRVVQTSCKTWTLAHRVMLGCWVSESRVLNLAGSKIGNTGSRFSFGFKFEFECSSHSIRVLLCVERLLNKSHNLRSSKPELEAPHD